MAAESLTSGFSSADAARILHIPVQQICAWQRDGSLRKSDGRFTLGDLGAMRRLRMLRGSRPAGRSQRQWIAALRSCLREEATAEQGQTVRNGARLVVRHGGALLDPIGTGQEVIVPIRKHRGYRDAGQLIRGAPGAFGRRERRPRGAEDRPAVQRSGEVRSGEFLRRRSMNLY